MWEWDVDRADQEQDPPNKVNMSALYIELQPYAEGHAICCCLPLLLRQLSLSPSDNRWPA